MSLRVFETDDAKYYLGLGYHDISSAPLFQEVDFSALDFMVFESGLVDSLEGFSYALKFYTQYSDLYTRIMAESKQISMYSIDSPPDNPTRDIIAEHSLPDLISLLGAGLATGKKATRRDILAGASIFVTGFLLSPIPVAVNFPGNEETNSIRTNLLPTPILGFRDALAAKKITEYLIPKHLQTGRKVQAAILYGAEHSGIEAKLQNPWLYQATLNLYHNKFGYKSAEELNRIMEVAKKDETITLKQYSCDLF